MFHWRLETKLVGEYVEYGINNQGNADAGNTEYCGEACRNIKLVVHQGGKTSNEFYSYLELCIASISFSTVFLRTGVCEETVARSFFPYNSTFGVLSSKKKEKKKKKRKRGIIGSA